MFSILIQESPILCQPSLHHFNTTPTPESGAITPDMMPIISPAFILISAIYGLLFNTLNLWDCPLVFVNLSEAAANLKRRPVEV